MRDLKKSPGSKILTPRVSSSVCERVFGQSTVLDGVLRWSVCGDWGNMEVFLVGDENKEVLQRVQPGTSHMRNEFPVESFFLSCNSSEFGFFWEVSSEDPTIHLWGCSMWPHGWRSQWAWCSQRRIKRAQLWVQLPQRLLWGALNNARAIFKGWRHGVLV